MSDSHNWPLQRGFDRYYGTIHGAGSYFDPSSLVRDNTIITVPNDPEYQPQEFYYTDAIADHAVKFLREHARIVAELKAQGQFDNTLILFLQDKGGCAEGVGRGTNFTARAPTCCHSAAGAGRTPARISVRQRASF